MALRKIPFETILDALLDESEVFPEHYLHYFSDIQPEHLKAFLDIWPRLSETRKRGLLEDLQDLAEADTLLSFDDLARALLDDDDPQVRAQAIRLLWTCDDPKLVPTFIRLLQQDDPTFSPAAATALGLFVYLGELEEIPSPLLREVEDALLAAAHHSAHPLVQRRAVESLGFSSRPEVIPLIEAAYARQEEPDWLVSALFAMGRSYNMRWQEDVIRMFDHEHPAVRAEAIWAAGELALSDASPLLLNSLSEENDSNVRDATIWALSKIGGDGVRELLEELYDQAEDEEEIAFLSDALDNLAFTESIDAFDMFTFDIPDEGDDEQETL
ncbi:MAG: HEAT repeat domain-containing protein [Anaerolineae bacterium]|nr:MAG: HEAT repeat domain-containing protein [Anaerolineae bacterium]